MLRLLIWTLIWLQTTGTNLEQPVVLFPEHIKQHPYFSKEYAQRHNLSGVKIYTSKKFEGRPIYKMSQYVELTFGSNFQPNGKKVIFESLQDTLETIIGYNGSPFPVRVLENTGKQWEYAVLQWENGYPEKIAYDSYFDRNANSITALINVGGQPDKTIYWDWKTRNNNLYFDIYKQYGYAVGEMHLLPSFQPQEFYYTHSDQRKSVRIKYTYQTNRRIATMQTGGRISYNKHVLEYEKDRIKAVKTYLNGDRLYELTDYFYNSTGSLRSVLTTNMQTKEMTIKEFRYSFY